VRRIASVDQLALPLQETTKVGRVLDAIDAAKDRALELLEPLYRPKPDLTLVETRPDGTPLDQPAFVPPTSWKLVARKGRLQRDGTRRGARILRRLTVYLEPLIAEELETYCTETDSDMSEVVNEAVRLWLDKR
jgi:hypothetical protein